VDNNTASGLRPPARYSKTAIVLHWLMAIIIVPLLLFGEQTMGSHDARWLPTVHASAGLVVFALFVIRFLWRLKHRPPATLSTARWELMGSRTVHRIFYAAMTLLPLTGWFAYTEHVRRSLGMRPASWFGFKIPLLPDFGVNWHMIHNWGGKAVLALIVVHAAAALKHQFYDRDDTLKRMLRF
jgi:cytochrome b561